MGVRVCEVDVVSKSGSVDAMHILKYGFLLEKKIGRIKENIKSVWYLSSPPERLNTLETEQAN